MESMKSKLKWKRDSESVMEENAAEMDVTSSSSSDAACLVHGDTRDAAKMAAAGGRRGWEVGGGNTKRMEDPWAGKNGRYTTTSHQRVQNPFQWQENILLWTRKRFENVFERLGTRKKLVNHVSHFIRVFKNQAWKR